MKKKADVCVWQIKDVGYARECGGPSKKVYAFCPFCGKRIKTEVTK